MKKIMTFLLGLLCIVSLYAQQRDIDTLKRLLRTEKTDTVRIKLLFEAGSSFGYGAKKNDSVFYYLQEALEIAIRKNDLFKISRAKGILCRYFYTYGNYKEALELAFQNLHYGNSTKDLNLLFYTYKELLKIYRKMEDYKQVLVYSEKLREVIGDYLAAHGVDSSHYYFVYNNNKSVAHEGLGNFDSAFYYAHLNYSMYKNSNLTGVALGAVNLAHVYEKMGKYDSAYYFYSICLSLAGKTSRHDIISVAKLGVSKYFHIKGATDSAFFYAWQALYEMKKLDEQSDIMDTYYFLTELHSSVHQFDSAYKYLQLYVSLKESLFSNKKIVQAQGYAFTETLEQQKMEQAKKEAEQEYRIRIQFYILAAAIAVFLIIAFLLWWNLHNKRKANALLGEQKVEIEQALWELKSTQSQLIQSEKMASLGELTAGIAHEIQNPLNFVNNFSEVNTELIDELEQEINKGNLAEVKMIVKDIKDNEQKINHHGKRADAIVKSMLQHSQSSSGKKEPTNINALADEYLRLAYHGLRAKDKSFNAAMKTEFDETIGNISIIPQDIGRVILNLITNAFYVVNEKSKQNIAGYEPIISINTKKEGNKVLISVKDNGNGIPQKILDKIFQPFFTTKPTGQGTGLGLSLSYDIVKAHGGEIRVSTKENEGTEFIVHLPIS